MKYFHVTAFVGEGLLGNPAGVCLPRRALDAAEMQAIAAELCLPETSFVFDEGDKLAIRWFAPGHEIALCGHGTLAAAHAWFSAVNPARDVLCFRSASGDVFVRRSQQDTQRLELDFPALPAQRIGVPAFAGALLGCPVVEAWQARALMLVLPDEESVRAAAPDIAALIRHAGCAVMVTAPGRQADFVSRYFGLGLNEDPVTGSAHCTLMPYWAARLGRDALVARQLSARGGELFCRMNGDRVLIGGYARLFLHGDITGDNA